jgi:deoxycytidylate deaminase
MATARMKAAAVATSPVKKVDDLRARRTDEIVIAFVGPIAAGCSTTARIIEKYLRNTYGYEDVFSYKVSELIQDAALLVGSAIDSSVTGLDRVIRLQDVGNDLRKKFNDDYLAAKVVEKIAVTRMEHDGFEKSETEALIPKPKRWAHLIDSLKNPRELGLLREVYGDMLWVVGVFAPEDVRKDRLVNVKRWKADAVSGLIARDFQQEWHYGQGVRDTMYQSDFFIRNDEDNDERLEKTVLRHIEVIFGAPVRTPTVEESSMYAAYSAASRSGCLSRQVGAALVSEHSEVIGIGCNDVPRFGGDLYSFEDGGKDHRCYKWGEKVCHNDQHKKRLYRDIFTALQKAELLKPEVRFESAQDVLKTTDVKQLIEFSRAVHAEMAALISVARNNKSGLKGATLYCTTFPCHSCARHMVAAGVAKIVYIEPYPKSLALELHRDAVSTSGKETKKKMVLEQYQGVAPRNLLRLFKQAEPARKNNGRVIDFNPQIAHPLGSVSVDDFSTHEKRVLHKLAGLEQAKQGHE